MVLIEIFAKNLRKVGFIQENGSVSYEFRWNSKTCLKKSSKRRIFTEKLHFLYEFHGNFAEIRKLTSKSLQKVELIPENGIFYMKFHCKFWKNGIFQHGSKVT